MLGMLYPMDFLILLSGLKNLPKCHGLCDHLYTWSGFHFFEKGTFSGTKTPLKSRILHYFGFQHYVVLCVTI